MSLYEPLQSLFFFIRVKLKQNVNICSWRMARKNAFIRVKLKQNVNLTRDELKRIYNTIRVKLKQNVNKQLNQNQYSQSIYQSKTKVECKFICVVINIITVFIRVKLKQNVNKIVSLFSFFVLPIRVKLKQNVNITLPKLLSAAVKLE